MTKINRALNLKYLGKTNISLSTALLFFYLFIGSSYTKDLTSGQLHDYVKSNRLAQHVIGYIMMLILIINIGGVTDVSKANVYSLISYSWFILSTKLDIQWNLAIFGLLVIGFIYETTMVDKEKRSLTDQALDDETRKRIKKRNAKMKSSIVIAIMAVTLVGTLLYKDKKLLQYGDKFDTYKFIMQPRNYKLVKN